MLSTYSFQNIIATISHPNVGKYVASGEGIGSINITMSDDRTVQDVAADGSIMSSKVRSRRGTITLTIQQTSALNKWLMKWFNYLEMANASEWTDTNINIRDTNAGDTTTAIGVAPQKQADRPYQANGQQVTWNLLAADIQQDPV
jgi:hypothetical protein